jgi:hypothetical protein
MENAVQRDALDLWVALSTVVTGVILATGALLAFIVQRSRYLRDIEPDIEVEWQSTKFDTGSSDVAGTLGSFDTWYIAPHIILKNVSSEVAKNVQMNGRMKFHHHDRQYEPQEASSDRNSRDTWCTFAGWLVSEVLPGRTVDPWCFLESIKAPAGREITRADIPIKGAWFIFEIDVFYFSRRELLTWIVWPFSTGRRKYRRLVSAVVRLHEQQTSNGLQVRTEQSQFGPPA